jgi:hypothetical protein
MRFRMIPQSKKGVLFMRRFLAPVAILPFAFGIFLPVAATAQSSTILGAYTPTFGGIGPLNTALGLAGGSLGIDNWYQKFYWNSLPRATDDINAGLSPMISWSPGIASGGCVQLSDVASGVYDSTLITEAGQIQALGHGVTVYLRLFFEMTDNPEESCANSGYSASTYIAAFQHVVTVFRAHLSSTGPTVFWVFAPGESAYTTGIWSDYYPGSSYVDIIAEDLYNRGGAEDFKGDVCSDAGSSGKPLMISETGALRNDSDDTVQVRWLNTVRTACSSLYAFVYWDAVGGSGTFDYTLNTSDTSVMGAFAGIAD